MDKTKMIPVRNRNNGSTGYYLPDSKINRTWAPEEVKMIPFEELQQAQWVSGVDYIFKNLLIIEDDEALKELNMTDVEPEYKYTVADIKDLLLNGTLDQLEDFLNFAPAGGIEVLKDIAVKEEVPNTRKREMISKKTGFSIDSAIMVNRVMNAEDEPQEEAKPERKAAAPAKAESATPARKSTPKYNVTSMGTPTKK